MRFHILFAIALVCLLLPAARGGCPAAVAESLLSADKAFAADTEAPAVEGWVPHFAPDARLLGIGDEQIVGLEKVSAHYRMAFPNLSAMPKWMPLHADCSADGTLGFTYGTWVSRTTPQASGQYLTVWRKQSDGSWKVLFDLGNKR